MFSPEGSRAFRKFLEETVGPVMAGPTTMLLYIAANGECSDADVIKRARGAGILPLLRKLPNWFAYGGDGVWRVTAEGLNEAEKIVAELAGQDEML